MLCKYPYDMIFKKDAVFSLQKSERPRKKLHEKGTSDKQTKRHTSLLLDQLGPEGWVGENIQFGYAKPNVLCKIVGWLVGARNGKILGFKKIRNNKNKSRINQEMVNTKVLPHPPK